MTDPQTAPPEPDPSDGAAELGVDMEQYHTDEGYDFDAAFREVAGEPFRFRWAGRWWELPHVLELDRRSVTKVYALADTPDHDDIEAVAGLVGDVLRAVLGEEAADEFEETPQPPLKLVMLFNQWQAHSGVKAGESRGSATSSNGTAGRSKRTSRASTAGSGSTRRSTAGRKTAARRVKSSR